ncbi:HAUS augmin-like complex subunit 1 isoform X1 [Rhopilema esculentum]|uniref:HAUS augmin-like complex subunit 1 isoform X1 n=2 Tax=Rhopilema esculentum TaxID=499914 RepID=UPI0031CFA9EA|eukprot:gene5973-11334_t
MDDDSTLHKQYEEVLIWLESVFQEKKIPPFEINKHTIAKIHNFMTLNKEMDKISKIIADDLKRKEQEYSIKADKIDKVLSDVGITVDTLSQSGVRNLTMLSDLAAYLRIKDTRDPSYVLALVDLLGSAEESSHKLKQHELKLQHIQQGIKEAISKKELLKELSESHELQMATEHPINEKRKKEMQFLKGKSEEYKAFIGDIQEINSKNGVSSDIHHDTLKQVHQELTEIQGQINAIKIRLSEFHSLPPDMSLARVKIEEARQELQKLESDLYNDLELLNL